MKTNVLSLNVIIFFATVKQIKLQFSVTVVQELCVAFVQLESLDEKLDSEMSNT